MTARSGPLAIGAPRSPMALRALAAVCGLASAAAAFCADGVGDFDLRDDGGKASVDVIIAQAPLLSTNPKVGQKLGWLGLYHTAIVFRQNGETPRYWTLEFEFVAGSMLHAVMPVIVGDQLEWSNDAKFCLSRDILWGRQHWTKSFDLVLSLTANQTHRVLQDFVRPMNSSLHGQQPQYQVWRVARTGTTGETRDNMLIGDVTCANAATWMLHFVQTQLGVSTQRDYVFRGTSALMHATAIEPVNTTDPYEWAKVVKFYRHIADLQGHASGLEKLWDVIEVIRHEYVYDTNAHRYYRIEGNRFPWFRWEYMAFPIEQGPIPYEPKPPAAESDIVVV